MKTRLNFTLLILALIMLFGLPAAVQAQITYATNGDGTITITNYIGTGGAVVFPTNINGLLVTGIGNGQTPVFPSNNVTSVTIPNSVTSIGSNAFFACTSLTNVTIANSVTNIGAYAFGQCNSLAGAIIPNSVIYMGDGTFYYCSDLSSIAIGTNVTSIGFDAFIGCNLTSLTIPNSVTSIGGYAFDGCPLTNFTFPSSVANIAAPVFLGCSVLTTITVDAQNSFYSSVDGVLFNKSQNTLLEYPAGLSGSYTIPGTVTTIGEETFSSESSLTSVFIPGSVNSIGEYAFYDCTGLASVYFGGNAPSVGYEAFGDDNATFYYLPGTTGWSAFSTTYAISVVQWLTGYLQVTLTSGAAYGGAQWQLDGGTNLYNSGVIVSNLTVGNHTVSFTTVNGWTTPAPQIVSVITNFFATASGIYLPIPFIYTTNNGTITITGYTGSGGAVVIPANINGVMVSAIGSNAFSYYPKLTSVTIPDSITNIEYEAFESCTGLTSLYFEGNAPVVGSYVFSGDSNTNTTVYYLPGATGWGMTLGGIPTKELTVLMVATDLLPGGTSGEAYSQQLTAWGGEPLYTWTLVSGGLPEGTTLGTNGVISGIPTTNGIFNFVVKVTDATNSTATQALSLNIAVSPLQITTGTLPNATNAVSYSEQLSAAFGHPPYSWSLISGSLPSGLTLASNGLISGSPTFIGTSSFTVQVTDALSITAPETFTVTVLLRILHNFQYGDGTDTGANLLFSGSTLYGTARFGGSAGNGTVFAVNTDGTAFTNLHSFSAINNYINSDGANPYRAGLILSGNTLYGTAYNGGSAGYGVVFAISTNGTVFSNLYSFQYNEGAASEAGLILAGNTLYGTTVAGGNSLYGTVFAISTNGTGITNLHDFTAISGTNSTNSDGAQPQDGLILSGNTLYGTASAGGNGGSGAVFAVNTNATSFSNLHSFATASGSYSTNSDGDNPFASVVLSGNTLYGTAYYGGEDGYGTVFAVNTDGTGFTILHTFVYSDGSHPAGLVLSGKTLYGTTQQGGSGTIFAINTDGSAFTNLYYFTGGDDGGYPEAGLILSSNTLYGTTTSGGANGYGTIFSLSLPLSFFRLAVTTVSLPNGTNGLAYSQQLSAVNGQQPYIWSLLSGSLPTGMILATNGLISGTPTTNGTFNFTVNVTDALSSTATQALTLMLLGPPIVALQPTNSSVAATIGSNVSFGVSVTGAGPFTYQWQLNGSNLPNGIITTLAGDGYTNQYGGGGFSGDGGPATSAELNYPEGVAVDAFNNVFIGDQNNERIRKVGTNGIITTVAGDGYVNTSIGYGGYSGDGGAATNAALNEPNGVAVDASGNLFIADLYNYRIRKVGTNGIITTAAGDGPSFPTNGVYSGDGGAATNAGLNSPSGVAVDAAGNLYIADQDNNRIREVGTNGIITTVAGNGTNSYSGDGGPATNAELNHPYSVMVDKGGNLFIVDSYNDRIREVSTNGNITTVAGGMFNGLGDGGAATNAQLADPGGVAVDASGNMFIADSEDGRIRMVGTNGIITTVAGNGTRGYSGDGGAATNAAFYYPEGVAVDTAGNLLIADYANHRIRKVFSPATPATDPTLVLSDVGAWSAGAYDVVVSNPYGSVTSSVINLTITTPLQITTTSLPNGTNGLAYTQTLTASGGQPPFSWTNISGALPPGLALATNGVISGTPTTNGTFNFTVNVTDALSETATQALALTVIGLPRVTIQPTNNPVGVGSNVTFSASVSGTGPFTYQWQLNGTNLPNGIITTVAGNGTTGYSGDGGAATNAELDQPGRVTVDAAGNLFITDGNNQRIRKVISNGIISTVAGNGISWYSGDGGAATNAELRFPSGVAVDAVGNLFIADVQNCRIRRVGANGIITTVAGNGYTNQYGAGGYSGDGGAATNAELNQPIDVAVDATGNLFIADNLNNRIRKVGTNGIITTVAGNGYGAPNGGGYSGDGGAATNAELYWPSGVVVDATGNLFIADFRNNVIRKVGTNGIITTVAGNGYDAGTGDGGYSGDGGAATNAELDEPGGVALDATGNLFIADSGNNVIREVGTNGTITTVAGNGYGAGFFPPQGGYSGDSGAATNAKLWYPSDVAVDTTGNLFIADDYNQRIRKVVFQGSTLVLNDVGYGNGGAYDVVVSSPYGSVTSSVVNLTITAPLQVTTVSLPNGTNGVPYIQTLTASGGQPPFSWTDTSGALPPGLALATNGVISGTTTTNGTFNFTVNVTDALSETATQALALTVIGLPRVTIQPTNNPVLVEAGSNVTLTVSVTGTGPFSYQWQRNGTNLPNAIITTVAGNGTYGYSGDGGTATNAELTYPAGVAVDATGSLFIADYYNFRIRKVGTNGIITTVAGDGTQGYSGDGGAATNAELGNANGMALDGAGNLFIVDTSNQRIRKVGTNGIITTVAGDGTQGYSGDGGAATNAELNNPYGVAVDATGNLFIADTSNQRIRRVGTNGIITTVAGNGTLGYFGGDGGAATNAELWGPSGVAVDAPGNLFIAELYNDRIRKVGTNGIITTVAGNGTFGYFGDGGAATNAELYYPHDVAVNASGSLFIADSYNNRIREVGTDGIINTAAGNGYGAPNDGGYSGDGGAAINAELYWPSGVAVDAAGNLFIADTENKRIRKVVNPNLNLNVTSSTLTLNNVGYENAGAYDVVVSSPYGSVTSSVVSVIVTVPVSLSTPQLMSNGQFRLTVNGGVTGQTYVLLASTNLVNWIPISGFVNTNPPLIIYDPNAANYRWRFYRIGPASVVPATELGVGIGAGSTQLFSSNGLNLALYSLPGLAYQIEASTDLVNWIVMTNFTSTNSPLYFSDPNAQNYKQRFYRAVLP